MDVLLHFVKPAKTARVDLKGEAEEEYRRVEEYDAVLRSHCGLEEE